MTYTVCIHLCLYNVLSRVYTRINFINCGHVHASRMLAYRVHMSLAITETDIWYNRTKVLQQSHVTREIHFWETAAQCILQQ